MEIWKFVAKHSFLHFCYIFRLEGGILNHKGSMGGACMFQGQIAKITPQKPGKSVNFPVLAPFLLVPP